MGDPAFCSRLRRPVTVEWIWPLLASAGRVLEIGAGDGQTIMFLARRFPNTVFVACERDDERFGQLQSQVKNLGLRNVRVVHSDFAACTESHPFDLIYAVDVLEHVRDDLNFLIQVHQRLQPGGRVFLHVPAPGLEVFEDADHVRGGYEISDLRDLLKRAELRILRIDYTFGPLGLRYHHSKVRLSRLRRMIVHLLDLSNDQKVRSEIGVIAERTEP